MEGNRDEVFSRRVRAGKRTYFIDVRATRSGEDYYLTITESKRSGESEREKYKIFLYKEDFEKFKDALAEALDFAYSELEKIDALPRDYYEAQEGGDDSDDDGYDDDDSDNY